MMKERDSNIELLRIIATLFILIVHCNGWFLREWGGITGWNTGSIAVAMSRVLIQNISCLGVDLFILITGFYGLRPKLKSIVNLFTLLLFFYAGCYLLDCGLGNETFSMRGLCNNLMALSRTNWFIHGYLILMLLSPMINAFVETSNTKRLGLYTLIYTAVTLYFGYYRANEYWFYNSSYSFTMMIGVYLVGRYMHRVIDILKDVNYWKFIGIFIGLIVLMSIIRVLSSNEEAWLHYGSPISIAAACVLFMLFYKLPIFHNKVINWIGVSCLAGFIFHTCDPVVTWLAETDVRLFETDIFSLYILKMGVIIFGVFVSAILLDKIRLLIFKPLINFCGKIKVLN